MDILNRRNTETAEQKLREMSAMIYEQDVKIMALTNTLSGIYERMNNLEKIVLNMKVKLAGTGASV